ncbi:MAG TPA: hypothetical protein VGK74_13940 [Symbiobacteriaceae bacterium]
MDLTPLYRKTVLTIAANKAVTAMATKVGMRLGASRFVAGETLEQALDAVRDLNRRGILLTMDQLGEGVHEERVAREMCAACLALLDGIATSGVNANVSLKLTQMGLSFDRKLTSRRTPTPRWRFSATSGARGSRTSGWSFSRTCTGRKRTSPS